MIPLLGDSVRWFSRSYQRPPPCPLLAQTALLSVLLFCIHVPSAFAQRAEADVLVAQAVLAYEDQQHEKAMELLDRALALNRDHVRGLYYKGLIYLHLKHPEQAVVPLESANQLQPGDVNIEQQLGIAHVTLGNYGRAASLLEDAFRQQPDSGNLAYHVGFLRFQQEDYHRALEAFSMAKSDDPNVTQLVAFYRGMCLGMLGLSDEAIAQLEQVERVDPTATITGPAVRIRNALAAQRSVQKPFRATVSLGGYYDDNVAINPNPSNNPVAEFLRTRKTISDGLLASALLDYSFYRQGPFEATATYSFFQTLNFNDNLSTFNIQNHQGSLAGFYRGTLRNSIPYQLALQYTYDYLFLDQAGFLSRNTMTFSPAVLFPALTLPFIGAVKNTTSPLIRYQIFNFLREVGDFDPRFGSDSRDGFNALIGFLHLFRLYDDRFILRLGYQYDNENTKGSTFSYSGNRLTTGMQYVLPWGRLTLRYDYDVHWRAYKNPQVNFTDDAGVLSQRYDIQQSHLIQIIKPLPWNLYWTLQFQHIRNDSNVPVFDFTKNVFTSVLSWSY